MYVIATWYTDKSHEQEKITQAINQLALNVIYKSIVVVNYVTASYVITQT